MPQYEAQNFSQPVCPALGIMKQESIQYLYLLKKNIVWLQKYVIVMDSRESSMFIYLFKGEFRMRSVMLFCSTISGGKSVMYESFTNSQVAVTNDKLLTCLFCHSRKRMYYVDGPDFHVLSLVTVVASLLEGFGFGII